MCHTKLDRQIQTEESEKRIQKNWRYQKCRRVFSLRLVQESLLLKRGPDIPPSPALKDAKLKTVKLHLASRSRALHLENVTIAPFDDIMIHKTPPNAMSFTQRHQPACPQLLKSPDVHSQSAAQELTRPY